MGIEDVAKTFDRMLDKLPELEEKGAKLAEKVSRLSVLAARRQEPTIERFRYALAPGMMNERERGAGHPIHYGSSFQFDTPSPDDDSIGSPQKHWLDTPEIRAIQRENRARRAREEDAEFEVKEDYRHWTGTKMDPHAWDAYRARRAEEDARKKEDELNSAEEAEARRGRGMEDGGAISITPGG